MQIAYRKIAQLALALDGEPPQLQSAASQPGETMESHASHEESRPLRSVPTGELLGRVVKRVTELLKKEAELARAEIAEQVRSTMKAAAGMALAVVFALLGLGLLCAAAVIGLANAMPAWLAALIVGFVMLAIAGVVAAAAKSKAGKKPLERTQRTLREDLQWAKERMA